MIGRSIAGACLLLVSLAVPAREPELAPRQLRGRAIEGMVASTGDESLRQFIDLHLAPEYRDSFGPGALLARLREIRAACAGSGGVLWEPAADGGMRVTFILESSRVSLVFRLQSAPPHRITDLELEPSRPNTAVAPDVPPLSWDSLPQRLDAAAQAGFTGTVLVVRGGTIVLHRGYGLAQRERGIANSTDTIYAIGSVPIDFTRAAVLKLEEMGKLKTSDLVGTFIPAVPDDKRSITLDQLMSGRSGLPDFHHIQGVDADFDLSWIDRETAVRRIMGQTLLFPPGKGHAHSHSAWVLLAAIVETVSGQPYGEFLKQQFFLPAGMTRTGCHEDAERFPDDSFAVGYGHSSVGKLNIPKYWGRTSWLVMGSGGMQSTPYDLYLWLRAIREGKTLSPASAAKYWTGGVLAGGDDRGFLCLYTEGPDDLVILCGNAHTGRDDATSAVGDRLTDLVRQEAGPRFSLGIQFQVMSGVSEGGDAGITVAQVAPGSAAERDGLKPGDVLLSANGVPMRDPIRPILDPYLQSGDAITFEILRDGARAKVTVRPNPRVKPPS